jgi:archaellum biogenesis ATPase FlaH
MVREEFVQRNPLRILEKSIRGGLKPGNMAVIASPKGVGKTACLVYIATVSLVQGKHVIHVSFSSRTDHIISWYEDIFREIAKKRNLEDAMETHNEIIRNRVIMNFNQDGLVPGQIVRSLRSMIKDGNFAADLVIVDGYNLSRGNIENFKALKEFAEEMGVCIWFSASTKTDVSLLPGVVPEELKPFMDYVDVLITLSDKKDFIALQLVKDYENYTQENLHVRLDPRTLLIAEEE